MILQVHDELVLEAPLDETDTVLDNVKTIMENAAKLAVPLDADAAVGANWAEAPRLSQKFADSLPRLRPLPIQYARKMLELDRLFRFSHSVPTAAILAAICDFDSLSAFVKRICVATEDSLDTSKTICKSVGLSG